MTQSHESLPGDPLAGQRPRRLLVGPGAPVDEAHELARRLEIPVESVPADHPQLGGARGHPPDPDDASLTWTVEGLAWLGPSGHVRVDFTDGRVGRRVRQGISAREPLARAIGLGGRTRPRIRRVLDATAGLGRDAFLLASLGCDVVAVERHPVVGALLADGLRRLPDDVLEGRLRYAAGDAREVLAGHPTDPPDVVPADWQPETVYIDPMFPARRKAALVKKDMQTLQGLVPESPEHELAALLDLALRHASRRVVVKRPTGAPALDAATRPSHAVTGGRTTRYDVYVTSTNTD